MGSSLWKRFEVPGNAREIVTEGPPGGILWAHDKGLLIKTIDGKYVMFKKTKNQVNKLISF